MGQQPNNPYRRDEWNAARSGQQAGRRRQPVGAADYGRTADRANGNPANTSLGAGRTDRPQSAARAQSGAGYSVNRAGGRPDGRPANRSVDRTGGGRAANTANRAGGRVAGYPANRAPHPASRAAGRAAGYPRTARAQGGMPCAAQTAEYNDYSRYVGQRQKRRRKSPIAIVVALVLLAGIGAGAYFFLNPPTFDITVNGVKQTVGRGATLETVLDEGMATPTPGNLLAIDGSVIQEGGGAKFAATINGAATADTATALRKNDAVEIANGADVTETFQTTSEEVPFQRVEDDNYWNGSLHVYTKGVNGVRTTKTGDVSGISITEDTQPVVNEGYHIYTADTGGDKVIALTFDDGPWPTTTDEILDILDQYDAKATFFTIGNQVDKHADSVKRAYEAGHQICTHTWDHASGSGQGVNLTYMSADEQITEVQKGFDAIKQVIGTEPEHVMRAPGGNFHGSIVWTLEPYITAEIGWNVDTEDWRRPGADAIAQRIMKAQPGDVVLMHDGGGDRSQTVEALKQALPKLKEEGYRFVTIDDLLAYGIPDEG